MIAKSSREPPKKRILITVLCWTGLEKASKKKTLRMATWQIDLAGTSNRRISITAIW